MFCTRCGTQITPEAKFCGNCGAAVPQDNGALASSASQVAAPPAETLAPHTVSTARPWPRVFARSIDTLLFSVFVTIVILIAIPEAFLVLAFYFFIGPFTLLLWAFLESAILARGNTLGKWLMGVRVRSVNGNRSSFAHLLQRHLRVLWRGLGLGLPIIGLVTNIIAYDDLKKNGSTSWDREGNFKVFYSRIGWPKVVLAVLLAFMTLFIFAITQSVIESRVEYLTSNPGHIKSASEPFQSSIAAPTSQQVRSQEISTDTNANAAARADKKDAEGTPQVQFDSNEIARSALTEINKVAENRMIALNGLISENLDGPYAEDVLNPEKLVSSQGVFEQKAKLKSISASLEQRAKNDIAIREYENGQFDKATKTNQFTAEVVEAFKAKREEAWRIDNEFAVCRQILNKAIDDVLFIFIARGGNVSGIENGKIVFQSPLNNSEYSRLLLAVNSMEADCSFKKSRQTSVSAMTIKDLQK